MSTHSTNSRKFLQLTQQLDRNYDAYQRLQVRAAEVRDSKYYTIYKTEAHRQRELERLCLVAERVLRLRERLLSKIGRLTIALQANTVRLRRVYLSEVNQPEIVEP